MSHRLFFFFFCNYNQMRSSVIVYRRQGHVCVYFIWWFQWKERLGYVCNPRSLNEGTETSRRRTDELGYRLERPIHFECKLNEPMHIGMRLLHPAAADHSVSINRQQVQRIFRFSLRSRAGARPLSGGTGRHVGGYCPFQCPVEASCAVIFWRRLGPP